MMRVRVAAPIALVLVAGCSLVGRELGDTVGSSLKEAMKDVKQSEQQSSDQQAHAYLDDEVTKRRVERALGGIDGVAVSVTNGTVELSGRVASADDKRRAEERARSIDRVQRVDDHIAVGR
jgi:osmotically-inducible protein OsmY